MKGPALFSAHTCLASPPCLERLCPPGPECHPTSPEGLALVVSEAPSPLALNSTSLPLSSVPRGRRLSRPPSPAPWLGPRAAVVGDGMRTLAGEFSHPSLPIPASPISRTQPSAPPSPATKFRSVGPSRGKHPLPARPLPWEETEGGTEAFRFVQLGSDVKRS